MIYSVDCNQYLAETYSIALQISDEAVKHCMFKGAKWEFKADKPELAVQTQIKLLCEKRMLARVITDNGNT